MAIAKPAQNVTRHAAASTGAPPARADTTPSSAENANDARTTRAISMRGGASHATSSGSAAPTEKLAADAIAA